MCFVPATFEIAGMILLAPKLLGITVLEAAVTGAVVGAVSPAVIVPKMIKLIEEKYGTNKGIPQLILAGASVDIGYVWDAGLTMVILIAAVLCFRMAGVFICLMATQLSIKERLFCMLACTPKATVQAGIGGVPMAMGLSCGSIVLTAAVLAILITAPLGAFMIELTYKKLLTHG